MYFAVKKAIANSGFKTVTIVGHSLGGALALLDSIYLPTFIPNVAYSLITFGMPRVGNQAFADYVDKNYFHLNVTRITNKYIFPSSVCGMTPSLTLWLIRKDPVPTLPGRHDEFHHPQGEKHIQVDGAWLSCFGQDNEDSRCSIGSVPNVKAGNVTDHDGMFLITRQSRSYPQSFIGPYDGVLIGCRSS